MNGSLLSFLGKVKDPHTNLMNILFNLYAVTLSPHPDANIKLSASGKIQLFKVGVKVKAYRLKDIN